jgi:hypothetical protein
VLCFQQQTQDRQQVTAHLPHDPARDGFSSHINPSFLVTLQVMRVMQRLLDQDNLSSGEAAAFQQAGTSPTEVLAALSADAELAGLLAHPTVRTALAQIRANPDAGLRRWGSEPLVSRALDLLEQVLGDGGMGAVVDVVAEEVKQQQQQRQ